MESRSTLKKCTPADESTLEEVTNLQSTRLGRDELEADVTSSKPATQTARARKRRLSRVVNVELSLKSLVQLWRKSGRNVSAFLNLVEKTEGKTRDGTDHGNI